MANNLHGLKIHFLRQLRCIFLSFIKVTFVDQHEEPHLVLVGQCIYSFVRLFYVAFILLNVCNRFSFVKRTVQRLTLTLFFPTLQIVVPPHITYNFCLLKMQQGLLFSRLTQGGGGEVLFALFWYKNCDRHCKKQWVVKAKQKCFNRAYSEFY